MIVIVSFHCSIMSIEHIYTLFKSPHRKICYFTLPHSRPSKGPAGHPRVPDPRLVNAWPPVTATIGLSDWNPGIATVVFRLFSQITRDEWRFVFLSPYSFA